MSTSIGTRVKFAREAKGLSQEELGDRVGINRSHLSKIERDEITPRGRLRLKLAEALGVGAEWIRLGTGPMDPPDPLPVTDPPPPGAEHLPAAWVLIKRTLAERKIHLDEEPMSDLFLRVARICLDEQRPAAEADVTAALVQLIRG